MSDDKKDQNGEFEDEFDQNTSGEEQWDEPDEDIQDLDYEEEFDEEGDFAEDQLAGEEAGFEGDDEYVEAEDDFEEDWEDDFDEDLEHTGQDQPQGKKLPISNNMIIAGGVVIGLIVIYFQFMGGGGGQSQSGASQDGPPQPVAMSSQPREPGKTTDQDQDASMQGMPSGAQERAQQEAKQDKPEKGFLSDPSELSFNEDGETDQQQPDQTGQPERPAQIAQGDLPGTDITPSPIQPSQPVDVPGRDPVAQPPSQSQLDENMAPVPGGMGQGTRGGMQEQDMDEKPSMSAGLPQARDIQKASQGETDQQPPRATEQPAMSGAQVERAVSRAVENTLGNKLDPLLDRMDSLENRLSDIESREARPARQAADPETQKTLQSIQSEMSRLNSRIDQVNTKIESAQGQVARLEEKATLPQPRQTQIEARTRPQKPQRAPVKWRLRGATPNMATVSDSRSGDIRTVAVGDSIPGIGQIRDIRYQNGQWVVQGTRGRISR